MESLKRRQQIGNLLCNGGLAIYLIWLLLPAVQQACHSVPGVLAFLLLIAGMILDWSYFSKNWWKVLIQCVCVLGVSYAATMLLRHGVNNPRSYMVSQCMFWYPVMLAGYFFTNPNCKIWKGMHRLLLVCILITLVITVFWNVEGMVHPMKNGKVRAYSRLIYDRFTAGKDIISYNAKNIGSLPFVYAVLLLLPILFSYIAKNKGIRRLSYIAFSLLCMGLIITSQFTFAIIFMACIVWTEGIGQLICILSRGKVKKGLSMVLAAVPLLLIVLFISPIVSFAYQYVTDHNLSFMKVSLKALYKATRDGFPGIIRNTVATFHELSVNMPSATLADGSWNDLGRLKLYLMSVLGFTRSPWVGSIFGAAHCLGYHSDILDALSGCGILGSAALCGMVAYLIKDCRGKVRKRPESAHWKLCFSIAVATLFLTTYLTSREVSAVLCTELLILYGKTGSLKEMLPEKNQQD